MSEQQNDNQYEKEVKEHIAYVRHNLLFIINELYTRGDEHDASKLESPEREVFREHQGKLKDIEFGSPEYKAMLDTVRPAILNHYAKNRHHPEHWPNGIEDMDLIDLIEMVADWVAATKRNKNGNVHKSLAHNVPKFRISPQLEKILLNTINRYF